MQGGGASATRSRSGPVSLGVVPVCSLKNPYLSAFRNGRKKYSVVGCSAPVLVACFPHAGPPWGAGPSPGCAQPWGRVVGMHGEWSGAAGGLVFAPGSPHVTRKVRHCRGSFAGHSQVLKTWPEAKHGFTPRGWGLAKKISVL